MKNNDKCQNLKVKTGKQANIKKISKTNKHPNNNTKTKTQNPQTKSAPTNPDQMEAVLCWLTLPAMGSTLDVTAVPGDTPLEKTEFPLSTKYQLQTASEFW